MNLPWDIKKKVNVGIVGDFILDEYLEGDVNRISPEAPVPIHNVRSNRIIAGGAANVARNVKLLGGSVSVFGILGKDSSGDFLKEILAKDGINTEGLLSDDDATTIKKTRVSAGKQQLLRIDWEKIVPISEKMQNRLLKIITGQNFDAILISDYGKGGLSDAYLRGILDFALKNNIPVTVDPKGNDFSRYNGASLITPNRKEALWALGYDSLAELEKEDICQDLLKKYQIQNILVTLGAEGMMLGKNQIKENPKKTFHYLSAEKREVYDVSGAGDTVIAVMTLVMGAKFSLEKGMYWANKAAGLECEKWGTYPISSEELVAAATLEKSTSFKDTKEKFISLKDFVSKKNQWNQRDIKIVFTNGCFDLLHSGHVSYLEEARKLGDILVIGINSDSSIKKIKGNLRPIQPLNHRSRVLSALSCVDFVIPFDEDTPLNLIKKISPNILVKGSDYTVEQIIGNKEVLNSGGTVETIPLIEGQSTSTLIQKIIDQDKQNPDNTKNN